LRIDAYLLKPAQHDELLETIYRVIGRTGDEESSTQRAAPAPATVPLRVLVAEDNEFNAQHLTQLLAMRGHFVRLVANGRDALDLIAGGGFDLLLLDIHMPEVDGFQVVRVLRQREQTAGGHLPVIALTARSRTEDRRQCLDAGMDDYLSKPIRAADLLAAIDRLVLEGGASSTAQPYATDHARLIDPMVLLAACGGFEKLLDEMCRHFKSNTRSLIADLGDALKDHDAPRLYEAAHKLYGTISAFSTIGGAVASDLEDLAARGQLEDARPLIDRLEAMVAELIEQVNGLSIETLRDQVRNSVKPHRTVGS
jgi:CheY-like chemotaxis protein/HPt (histidine-containing phosphotransfer) domain-containing protein